MSRSCPTWPPGGSRPSTWPPPTPPPEGSTPRSSSSPCTASGCPGTSLLGEPGRITVDRADGTIELTEAEVNRLLADRLQGGTLAIKENGVELRVQVPLLGQTLEARVTGELGARDGRVTFTPDEIRLGEQGRDRPVSRGPAGLPVHLRGATARAAGRGAPGAGRHPPGNGRPQRARGRRRCGRLIRWAYDPGVLVHGPAGGDADRRGRVRRLRGLPPTQGLRAPGRKRPRELALGSRERCLLGRTRPRLPGFGDLFGFRG